MLLASLQLKVEKWYNDSPKFNIFKTLIINFGSHKLSIYRAIIKLSILCKKRERYLPRKRNNREAREF